MASFAAAGGDTDPTGRLDGKRECAPGCARWLLFGNEDLELYEDLYVRLCASHDRAMDDKRVGCPPLGPGPSDRCGDVLLQHVLAVFERTTAELLL